jgi:Cu+-exporting ATPase
VRPEARWVVQQLRAKEIDVAIVSGDNTKTVNHIASQLGVTRVFAEVLPKDKKDKVELLQSEGHCVAMVGDGINDSPALALADVGFAIGAGSDVAIESAGVVLMRSSLVDIMTAIDLAQTTSRRIKLNFFWAFAYNLASIPVAAGVFFPIWKLSLPPWVAGAAMAVSSVSVVTSSLLLKWYSPPTAPTEFGDSSIDVEAMLDNDLSDDEDYNVSLDEIEERGLISSYGRPSDSSK